MLPLLWFLPILPACSETVTVDVCGRGDHADLAAALVGGRLSLEFRDGIGDSLATIAAPADHPTNLTMTVPGGTATVVVSGLRADGSVAAAGPPALVSNGSACACLALTSQQTAACGGLRCRVENGGCVFFDTVTGAPAGTRTIRLGENEQDDLHDVTADTTLVNDTTHVDDNYGIQKIFSPDGTPPQVGLLRFELGGLPRSAVISQAALALQVTDAGGAPVQLYRVLEAWDEGHANGDPGCASWNCRMTGVPWTVPGCGFLDAAHRSREDTPLGSMPMNVGLQTLDVTAAVVGWVADPTTNFGFALTESAGSGEDFASHEALSTMLRPELVVLYTLP